MTIQRNFAKITRIVSLILCVMVLSQCSRTQAVETFEVGQKTFLLNGEPFIVKAAEIHYPRIPREYWEHRIQMCKSLGMNTICIYIFWNAHEPEPGKFDFKGNNDIAAFCRLAQDNGMYVIVRPGPYVCAEWDMGGLPWWLLKKKDIRLRELDPYFMERVKIFENEVGKQLAPFTIANGGPIIMVQVENEYGSYGEDKPYVAAIRDIVKEAGFAESVLFQCDWNSNFTLNGLDDLLWTMNFGTGADIDRQFEELKKLRPETPLMCSEYWSGWFDDWGNAHETRDATYMVAGLKEMLEKNVSFSLYMTHGGTSFGHWAGANSPGYHPRCTSYDYDAPINEAGQATPKFWVLREMMAEFNKGKKLPDVPKEYPVIEIPEIQFLEIAPIFDNLPQPIISDKVKPMEDFDQGYGSILYSTTLPEIKGESILKITEAHDWARIFVDGTLVGTLDRRFDEKEVVLPTLKKDAKLDILVENMGRINYGRTINDNKGITQSVELTVNGTTNELNNWKIYSLPDSYEFLSSRQFIERTTTNLKPGYYRATFNLDRTGDTFLNMANWGKGQVFVNGHALGRFWKIGPQQTLYLPGCWLKEGENEIIVLDLCGPLQPIVSGLNKPILDKLNNMGAVTHRKENQMLNLSAEQPSYSGTFAFRNSWQEVLFGKTIDGRFFCLDAVDGFKDLNAAVAELELLDASGQLLDRENWSIVYADSEEILSGNRTADKIYDHQESTFWQSAKGVAYPHQLVIDLGKETKLSGFRYLPRMEQECHGLIKTFRIFIKQSEFKIN